MLTNEEKINLRERALRLSFELPNPIPQRDSEMLWAEEVYRHLSKDLDDDPLRLDISSPAWRHESDMSPEEYWRLHSKMQGIDWSRRQILTSPTGVVLVEVSGDGDEAGRFFYGYRLDSELKRVSPVCSWLKSVFVYHGEIPQEQQETPKTTGLNLLEAVKCIQEGKKVRRSRQQNYYQMDSEDSDYIENEDGHRVSIRILEVLATDWQIIEP